MNYKRRGFTVTEIIVVVGITIILISLLWPSFNSIRSRAKKVQCAGNLAQIYHGLAMYSVDNSRVGEVFPASMTNLINGDPAGSYVSDERVFVCPMDYTKAGQVTGSPRTLKPGAPYDNFASQAERVGNTSPDFGYLLNQRNSSYKYEFSSGIVETYAYDPAGSSWNYDRTGLCDSYLVSKDISDGIGYEPTPEEVDRFGVAMPDGSIGITYADFKFHQLAYGDTYITGSVDAPTPPPDGFEDPQNYYDDQFMNTDYFDYTQIVTSYSRTWLPVVRCFWHMTDGHIDNPAFEEVQNVSLDGNIFDSESYWERTAFKYGPKSGDTGGSN